MNELEEASKMMMNLNYLYEYGLEMAKLAFMKERGRLPVHGEIGKIKFSGGDFDLEFEPTPEDFAGGQG